MDQPIDVADCLRRWRQGDERAAEDLIGHLYPVVVRIVRTHLSRRDHEEDLVQEVFMKTFSGSINTRRRSRFRIGFAFGRHHLP